MAHAAAILIGADIQTLVQAGFDASVSPLRRLPLRRVQAFGFATGEQILEVGFVSQALTENNRALRRGWKAGLFRADRRGAERADFSPASIFLGSGVRPVGRHRLWRGKKAAPLSAAAGPRSGATSSDWL